MNALQKTIAQLRTLTLAELDAAEGIASVKLTKAEWEVFSAAVRIVRAAR